MWTNLNVIVLIRQFFLSITFINGVGATTLPTGVSLYVVQSKEELTELIIIIIIIIIISECLTSHL